MNNHSTTPYAASLPYAYPDVELLLAPEEGESASGTPHPPRRRAMEMLASRVFVWGEYTFAALSLFIFSQALLPFLIYSMGASVGLAEGHPLLRGVNVGIYGVMGLLILPRIPQMFRTALQHKSTLLLVMLALASVLWSTAPDITLRRSVALLATTVFGIYLASRFDMRDLLRILGVTMGISMVLTVLFALAHPMGVHSGAHFGAWRGIYVTKNNMGQVMAMAAAVFFLLSFTLERRRWMGQLAFLMAVSLVLLSMSKSALVVLLTLALMIPAFYAMRWHYLKALPFFLVAILVSGAAGLWIMMNRELLLLSMGRDATMTGRLPLWEATIAQAAQQPWLGHGFSGFWLGVYGPSLEVWYRVGWTPPHAHNGFIDLALDLGIIGVAIYAVGFLIAFVRSLGMIRRSSKGIERYWPLVFLSFVLLCNFTESTILRQNDMFWILYVTVACSVGANLKNGSEETRQRLPWRGRTHLKKVASR